MNPDTAPARPKRPAIRLFSNTPIARWITARQATISVGGGWAGLHLLDAPLWVKLPLLALTIAFFLWIVLGAAHGRFLDATRTLHRQLRWFDGDAVTWFHPDQAGELQAALRQMHVHVHVHELQGEAMRSIGDLQRELERRFGAPAWPKQPVARCISILERLPQQPRGVHVIVWHAADACVDGDAGAREFLARWTGTMAKSTPHVLLFLGRPRAPAAPASAPESPLDPVAAAPAPDGAWWKPRPGELVD